VVVTRIGEVELAEVPCAPHGHLLATQAIQAGVDDDAVQPRGDRGLAPVGVGPAEG
jgi:hypothetical protein